VRWRSEVAVRYDVHPPLGHPEVAGWALGALDRPESEAFGEHLRSCGRCQAAVAEFESVAAALSRPVPADEPPAGLEARVVAAVRHAAVIPAEEPARRPAEAAEYPRAEIPPAEQDWQAVEAWQVIQVPRAEEASPAEEVPRPADAGRQEREIPGGRWGNLVLAAAAAVAAAIVAAIILLGLGAFRSAPPAAAAVIALHARAGFTGSGTATTRQAEGGWSVQLTVRDLKKLAAGQFYECWYADRSELIAAGTFTVTGGGSQTFTMASAADPRRFGTVEITAQSRGDASRPGRVILAGTARG
jgi:hypothetical protein